MNRPKILALYLLDLVLVVAFAAVGRSTHHDEVFGRFGIKLWTTAWPFAVCLTLGWLVLRAWRHPLRLSVGFGLWLITVVGGLALRGLTGGGLALPFVLVATGVTGILLVGWRMGVQIAYRGDRAGGVERRINE